MGNEGKNPFEAKLEANRLKRENARKIVERLQETNLLNELGNAFYVISSIIYRHHMFKTNPQWHKTEHFVRFRADFEDYNGLVLELEAMGIKFNKKLKGKNIEKMTSHAERLQLTAFSMLNSTIDISLLIKATRTDDFHRLNLKNAVNLPAAQYPEAKAIADEKANAAGHQTGDITSVYDALEVNLEKLQTLRKSLTRSDEPSPEPDTKEPLPTSKNPSRPDVNKKAHLTLCTNQSDKQLRAV